MFAVQFLFLDSGTRPPFCFYAEKGFIISQSYHMPAAQPKRLAILVVLAFALIWVDSHYSWLKPARYSLSYVLVPVQQLSVLPQMFSQGMNEAMTSREALLTENEQLKSRNLVLELRAQRLVNLETENIELRELLHAAEMVDDRVLITSIIAVDPDPYSQQVLINKGGKDGVFIGQPVLDAYGLLGQVIDVQPYSARVLMIADINHAMPVQVNRNGVRAIAQGTGSLTELELIYVPATADIIPGDVLVSSGLGERYPRGYPVATVSSVENTPGDPFAKVMAVPSAQLERSRLLLLVFSKGSAHVPPQEIWKSN
ncbi:MAG: hypothetical protein RL217_1581 [Pseudomonadota bacterium]|jgi:rod shape-determining protein MreC